MMISDWRLYTDSPETSVYFCPNNGATPVAGETLTIATKLASAAQASRNGRARWSMLYEGRNFRCEAMPNRGIAVRAVPFAVPSLDDLKVPTGYQRLLMNPRLSAGGGLVVVSGSTGSGKSSTVSATVVERLKAGLHPYALTYESPIEYAMQGFHGTGYCDQNTVDDDYSIALAGALRCFPAQAQCILFIGEVLDAQTMRELMKVMQNGHMVITTTHALGLIETIQRFLTLAGANDSKPLRELFATSLRLVIHQRLVAGSLSMSALEITPAAEQLIVQDRLLNLKDEIGRTNDRLRIM